jgi:hypothetical protein
MSTLLATAQDAEIIPSRGPLLPPYSGPFDIPVLIDSVERSRDFDMTRSTFFTIEAASAIDDWVALLRERRIPFLLLGMSPVIHRPDLETPRFSSIGQIDELFNSIEDIGGLVVETAHIWLPNMLFDPSELRDLSSSAEDSPFRRGSVWRVSFELFQRALQFQREVLDTERFSEECRELMESSEPPVEYSYDETVVFRAWSTAQIEAARANYLEQREDPDRGVLSWIGKDGKVYPG